MAWYWWVIIGALAWAGLRDSWQALRWLGGTLSSDEDAAHLRMAGLPRAADRRLTKWEFENPVSGPSLLGLPGFICIAALVIVFVVACTVIDEAWCAVRGG